MCYKKIEMLTYYSTHKYILFIAPQTMTYVLILDISNTYSSNPNENFYKAIKANRDNIGKIKNNNDSICLLELHNLSRKNLIEKLKIISNTFRSDSNYNQVQIFIFVSGHGYITRNCHDHRLYTNQMDFSQINNSLINDNNSISAFEIINIFSDKLHVSIIWEPCRVIRDSLPYNAKINDNANAILIMSCNKKSASVGDIKYGGHLCFAFSSVMSLGLENWHSHVKVGVILNWILVSFQFKIFDHSQDSTKPELWVIGKDDDGNLIEETYKGIIKEITALTRQ
jgi:hypothetical protein